MPIKKEVIARWQKMWAEALDQNQKSKLRMILDGGNFVFLFRFKDEIYGGSEGSRVMFAKMKDPEDEDHSPGWIKEANFIAQNLTKLGQGQQSQSLFSEPDLKFIDVLTRDEAYEQLEEFFEKESKK